MSSNYFCDACGNGMDNERASRLDVASYAVYRHYDLCYDCALKMEKALEAMRRNHSSPPLSLAAEPPAPAAKGKTKTGILRFFRSKEKG